MPRGWPADVRPGREGDGMAGARIAASARNDRDDVAAAAAAATSL